MTEYHHKPGRRLTAEISLRVTGESRPLSDVGKLTLGNDAASPVLVPPGDQVTLYENAGFRGKKKVLRADTSYVGGDFNDIVSSLIVDLI